jgi:hypothetical protein
MDSPQALWEKLEGETPKAYRAFCIYRDEGPAKRSLRSTAALFYDGSSANLAQIGRWSKKYRWVQRVAAFDLEQDRIAQQQRREMAEEARDRARRGAQLLQSIALKGMTVINEGRLTAGGAMEPETNPPTSLLRFYREGVELEFVALGLPISVIRQQQVEPPTPEELERQQKADTYSRAARALE